MADHQPDAPPPIQPPPPIAPVTPASPTPGPGGSSRTWDMLCHLSALAGFVGVPFGNILGPLLVWQIKKNEFPSVDIHGKRALNFQITVTIAVIAAAMSGFVLSFVCVGYLLFPVAILIGLAGLIFAIIAGVKASNGEDYQYPYSFEFVK